ncbi:MAG TPA: helix-turn-helix transcriptional regulator, partial [Miltoncostaeaceae bacterium]|nr:helix-turn-helix transcriptional regulator [Miltoncostaeaceae bacterium]
EGLALAERCGARALAERARADLRAAGGRSSAPEGTGWEQLTASERRVAELAAEGGSNPEIAQALYVTRKTVETHLGRVYRKLGIAGRGELERALAARPPRGG